MNDCPDFTGVRVSRWPSTGSAGCCCSFWAGGCCAAALTASVWKVFAGLLWPWKKETLYFWVLASAFGRATQSVLYLAATSTWRESFPCVFKSPCSAGTLQHQLFVFVWGVFTTPDVWKTRKIFLLCYMLEKLEKLRMFHGQLCIPWKYFLVFSARLTCNMWAT